MESGLAAEHLYTSQNYFKRWCLGVLAVSFSHEMKATLDIAAPTPVREQPEEEDFVWTNQPRLPYRNSHRASMSVPIYSHSIINQT